MKTYNKTLEEGVKEFDYTFGSIVQSGYPLEPINPVGIFLTSFAEKIRESVVDSILAIRPKDIEGEARYHDSYNDGKRDVLDDLLAQLKDK